MELVTTDWHTAGEPFRIVTDGVPEIPGATVRDRRSTAQQDPAVQRVRELLCNEPRGHADMYGGFLVPPDDADADLGVLFWHKDGFSTACGHGSIALGVWAVRTGRVAAAPDGETDVVIDVPSGRVVVRVRCDGGAPVSATFRNVPSSVLARGVDADGVAVDLAYSGAIYASVPAAAVGLHVVPGDLHALIARARSIKAALHGHPATRHAEDERLGGVYGVIFHDELGPAHQRNVTVFADGEVDRSPCGSGTSARVALLWDAGLLPVGAVLTHDSIVGTTFAGSPVQEVRVDGRRAVVTEVEGMAYRTGEHRFVLDPDDPIGTGFQLR